ncbi:MAG: phospho-N-acetylmuramoyl-pentapeptide-transferase [Bacilli bacterium]|nr:phospho-N-acetylmuramoyl-pentapeptide-transferase [Bacilli bacterium]MDD4282602.1 phospho-N-acetylmuramoyl-pentapeptide-transferase [Bacilli bacterium]MDD4718528.1 phospho-N-acetylmuramoyl-pentapeptide-transferase [Bacilli bacterium]
MLILTKSVMVMMLSFIISIFFAIITIPILKKMKVGQRLSIYLEETHKKKSGTPTMGGIIFIVPTILVFIALWFFNKINITYSLVIVMVTFISYGILGFVDDYLIVKRKSNKGLSEATKLLSQLIVAIIFFYLFMKAGNEPLLWVHSLNIKLNIGWLYGVFILLVLVASSNAVNITDGLDGLAGGLSVIAFLAFGIISWGTGWLDGYEEIALLCFTLIGSLLGFLVFNVSPAKVFMGDTGSLAIGATLGAIAIITRHELLLMVIGIVFVIETMSCVIQRVYYKFTQKRIFLMTPIHHTFEKKGWDERDIVKMFWIIGLIGAMAAIIYGVWW